MKKARKIQSIIQDVIEGRKDNNEATIDILALCDVSQQREQLVDFAKYIFNTSFDEEIDVKDVDDYLKSINCG